MRILEARESFIKIESENNISTSSFLKIKGSDKSYIAQVIQNKKSEEKFIVFAKILFIYDDGIRNYDNTIPEKESEITECTQAILSKTLSVANSIVAGKFIDGGYNITINKNGFDKKTLISVDTPQYTKTILSNLSHQFKKHIIIDMSGIMTCKKFIAGSDFKLPLNTASLEFMYEDCLNDATAESKNLIKEIFNDLSEYSKSVPFLPFGTLKTIIDNMVDKEHIFKLLVLKNKLAKFDKLGYFAAKSEEAENLQRILNLDSAVIDLSKLDSVFQNRYLSTIYSIIDNMAGKPQLFIQASNAIDKKNLKKILTSKEIPAVFATHSKFKYLNEIKTMFDNFIIESSFTNNEVFKIYSAFLNSMPQKSCLIVGEGTNYIPFVSSIEEYTILPTEEPKTPVVKVIEKEVTGQEETIEETLESPIIEDDSELEEITEETPLEDAIERKSEEIIEQASAESIESPLNIFHEEDETNAEDEEVEELTPVVETEESFEDLEEPTEEILPQEEVLTEEDIENIESLNEEPDQEIIAEVPEEEALIEEIDEEILKEAIQEEAEKFVKNNEIVTENIEEEEEVVVEDGEAVEEIALETDFPTEVDDIQMIEIPEDISEFTEEIEEIEEETPVSEEIIEELPEQIIPEEIKLRDYSEEKDFQEEVPQVIQLEDSDVEFEEIIELDESEIDEEAIIVDFEDEEPLAEDELEKEIIEDVDKVFTTIKDDTISDSDLDFIDELNEEPEEIIEESLPEGMEELTEFEEEGEDDDGVLLEPIQEINEINEIEEEKEILETRNTSTPIVPVYDAEIPPEDMVMSDSIEQGDTVTHAKYGTGVVEKMIKYGTKTLYSINFDNVGRRLLDPTLTEIKKS